MGDLRFEHEKRRNKILALRMESGQNRARAHEIDAMEYDQWTKPEDMLDSGPTWGYINQLEEAIQSLELELDAIERVLEGRR